MAPGTQAATAQDGRTLRFAEWGDPAGFPVFSLHGTPGSRFSRHYDESTYAEVGARVITYDRRATEGPSGTPADASSTASTTSRRLRTRALQSRAPNDSGGKLPQARPPDRPLPY